MGICCKDDPPKKELKNIRVPNDDYSFIYSVLQALYNLNNFKTFILNDESKNENEIKMGKSLKDIFTEDINEDLINSSKIIYYRIKNYYNNSIEPYPEIILIKILELLNQEQKRKNNIDVITNLVNIQNKINSTNQYEEKEFYNYLKLYATNKNCNKIGEYFCIFFQKRISNYFQTNFAYEHKYVFELNLFDIFNKKSNVGTLSFNNSQMPELNLKECIMENSSPTISNYNFNQCMEQKFIYSTSAYLIFILNRRGNENCYYYGDFKYSNIIDLSSVILRKDKSNIYKLSSIIKEKRYLFTNSNNLSKTEYDFNYITINVDNTGSFYYYNNNKIISKMFKQQGYFDHILIFKQNK